MPSVPQHPGSDAASATLLFGFPWLSRSEGILPARRSAGSGSLQPPRSPRDTGNLGDMNWIPSGEPTNSNGKWPFIVDFPIEMVIFNSYVKLPEAIWWYVDRTDGTLYDIVSLERQVLIVLGLIKTCIGISPMTLKLGRHLKFGYPNGTCARHLCWWWGFQWADNNNDADN